MTPDDAIDILVTGKMPDTWDEIVAEIQRCFDARPLDVNGLVELGFNAKVVDGIMNIRVTEGMKNWCDQQPQNSYKFFAAIVVTTAILRNFEPVTRTEIAHKAIDAWLAKDPRKITCKAGCSFCCFIQVVMMEDEARLILAHHKLTDEQLQRFDTMSKWPEDPNLYARRPLAQRRCPFLQNNLCSIYEHRPAACRNHRSLDPPSYCDTMSREGGIARFPNNLNIDIIICAMMQLTPTDTMATLITKTLKEPTQ